MKIDDINSYELDFSPDSIESAQTLANYINAEVESRYFSNFTKTGKIYDAYFNKSLFVF